MIAVLFVSRLHYACWKFLSFTLISHYILYWSLSCCNLHVAVIEHMSRILLLLPGMQCWLI